MRLPTVAFLVGWAVLDQPDLQHPTTLCDVRFVSLPYSPQLCRIWIADEGMTLTLLSPVGREIMRVESGGRPVSPAS